ncbi:MAG TPA: 50S ribosome-binding GTPase [Spirochaetota bacterium]|nr:50S ribosome-binding GTPase [Spirochaetota bacterium]
MSEINEITVTFFGKTGVGKSTTLNMLFNLNNKVNDTTSCTKKPKKTSINSFHFSGLNYKKVNVVDLPGIGESISEDEKYMKYYKKWIPKSNVLVWITQSDTRAYKRDEIFLNKLLHLFHKSLYFIIAINKIEYLGCDSDETIDIENKIFSSEQKSRVNEKINDIYYLFNKTIDKRIKFEKKNIIAYSALHNWGLDNLKNTIFKGDKKNV